MKYIYLISVCFGLLILTNRALAQTSNLELTGRPAITLFRNATQDTITIQGTHYNWLPYVEQNFKLRVAPGRVDSVILHFNFNDLVTVNQSFSVMNAPGKRVVCTLTSLKKRSVAAAFSGDFDAENNYYLSYFNFLGDPDEESRAFYDQGDKLADFNLFPAIADSITNVRLNFLSAYPKALPAWFKGYEKDRLVHNGIMRKYNVLLSKIFYGGKPIPVDKSYYNFERLVRLADTLPASAAYLWAVDDYLHHRSGRVPNGTLKVIDSVMKRGLLSDAIKLRRLGMLYANKRIEYDALLQAATFSSPEAKLLADSLIQARLGLPKVGQKAPDMVLKNLNGEVVKLSDFKGKPVIINFWASWCGPCKAEFPAENRLYNKYKAQGLVVLNICIETKEATWISISKQAGLQMVNLFASPQVYSSIQSAYNIGALPRSIAIGRNQNVVAGYYQRASSLTDNDIVALLNAQ